MGAERAGPTSVCAITCGFPVHVQRATMTTRGVHAGLSGAASGSGDGSCTRRLAGGPRLRRQAGRGHRQRRDRGDAGARDGRARRPTSRCCSASRATWRSLPAEDRSPTGCAALCRRSGPTGSPAGRTCSTPVWAVQLRRAPKSRVPDRGDQKALGPDYDVDTPLRARATTRGTSGCACARRRPVHRIRTAGRGRHRPHRDLHRDRHPAGAGQEIEADLVVSGDRAEPAGVRRGGAHVDGARSTLPKT